MHKKGPTFSLWNGTVVHVIDPWKQNHAQGHRSNNEPHTRATYLRQQDPPQRVRYGRINTRHIEYNFIIFVLNHVHAEGGLQVSEEVSRSTLRLAVHLRG